MILIKTNKDTLLTPLQTVTGIVERRQTLPILSNVLIQNHKEDISFLTTDLEIQIKTSINNDFSNEKVFSLTVSAKKLQDILRSLPANTEIVLSRKNDHLQIKSGKSIFNLQILPAEDFPEVAEEGKSIACITLQQKELKNLLQHVQFSIAQQDIRYYLNGLLLLIEDTYLKGVATDGHRLAFASIDLDETKTKHQIILPRKAVFELTKLLNDTEEPIKIEFFKNKARFSFSNIILVSKVIDGKFPDFNRVIPKLNNKQFDLARLDFLQALQRVSILSNQTEQFRGVRLVLSKNNLCVICKNNEQEEAQDDIDIKYDDDDIDISLNITYLLDLLNNITADTIQCAFENANNSVLITIPENKDYKYIVMPMRI
jgi:DNA polymerase III subunit beta